MIELKSPEVAEGVETAMVPLFSINDKVYSVPNRVRPNVSMKYLYLLRTQGVGAAETYLGVALLGAEAYEALLDFEDLTQEQSDAIFAKARAITFGLSDPKDGEGEQNGSETETTSAATRTSKGSAKKAASTSKRTSGS